METNNNDNSLVLDDNYSRRLKNLPAETQFAINSYLTNGRPSKMTEDMLPKLLIMSAEGMSQAQISARLGVSKRTFLRWVSSDLKKGGSNGSKDAQNQTLQDKFRHTYIYGRALAQAFYDQLATNQLVNPDKAFNDRLYLATYNRRFAQNSTAPVLPEVDGLADAIASNDFDAMTKAVLSSASKGEICIDTLDIVVNAFKRSADMTVLEELQRRLEEIEQNN